MPSPFRPANWDVFCNVIDNYGDIGVCWRLARQLVGEHHIDVRLWVDDLGALQHLCPSIDPDRPAQIAHSVDVRRWTTEYPLEIVPGEVVIEGFGCRLPEQFIDAMAALSAAPAWINLDYLSAEKWVDGCHALPSPHPRLPLTKHFFFPGFSPKTGGLIREQAFDEKRRAFETSPELRQAFLQRLGVSEPAGDALLISLFAYENPEIADLLRACSDGERPVCILAPMARTLADIQDFAGQLLAVGDRVRRGPLDIWIIPFVEQDDYDRLLWLCDLNFVRGEDSFVRAQLAAKPMIWHIYPQDDNAHQIKLAAFLDTYCAALAPDEASLTRQIFGRWNSSSSGSEDPSTLWPTYLSALPALGKHAGNWAKNLNNQEDLCSRLVRFCRSKL